MKLLSSSVDVSRTIVRLIRNYDELYWAVAWASVGFEAYDALRQHSRKARMIVVGTQFYQTHPEFIAHFQSNKAFRYFYDNDAIAGVFHPKVFLFQKRDGELAAIVGSANFTRAALKSNCEICILLTPDDQRSSSILKSLKQRIESLWNSATPFPEGALNAYRDRWKRRWATETKSIFVTKPKTRGASFLETELLNLSWREIYAQMRNTVRFDARLQMLRELRTFFHPMIRFAELSLEQRQKVAGTFPNEVIADWGLFGSMKGAIDFKDRIKTNRAEISKALDCIPWESAVTRDHYEEFKETFRRAFVYSKMFQGVAVPSRLLAMKRPDYFLCIDSANRKELALRLKIPASRISFDSYWDLIERFIDTPWWNSSEPREPRERSAWLARVAMLDALLYKPGI